MKDYAGKVLIIVQNLPVPFDRRVWLEAKTLRDYGLKVSVISPKSKEFNKSHEVIGDISVYRYTMPVEAEGVLSYLFELVNEHSPSEKSMNDHKTAVSVEKKLGTWHDLHVLEMEENNFQS